jgi:hypothetical protein
MQDDVLVIAHNLLINYQRNMARFLARHQQDTEQLAAVHARLQHLETALESKQAAAGAPSDSRAGSFPRTSSSSAAAAAVSPAEQRLTLPRGTAFGYLMSDLGTEPLRIGACWCGLRARVYVCAHSAFFFFFFALGRGLHHVCE